MAFHAVWLSIAFITTAVAIVPDSSHITSTPASIQSRASFVNHAIVPTSSGQIGINPVSEELGNPNNYILTDLGPQNPVLTLSDNVYHYIEGHTNYLTVKTITTTLNKQPMTTISIEKVAINTAAAASGGGVGLAFSEDVANALRKTADAAIKACGLKRRSLSKRADSISCMIDAAVKASGADGPLEAVATDTFWESITADVAKNAPEYLTSAISVLKSQAQKRKALIILSAIIIGKEIVGPLAAVKIPSNGVGEPTTDDNTENKNKCDPNKPVNKDSPLCKDNDCQGNSGNQKCSVDPNKGCACLFIGTDGPPQESDQKWWDEQQRIFQSFSQNHSLLATAPPNPTPSGAPSTKGWSLTIYDNANAQPNPSGGDPWVCNQKDDTKSRVFSGNEFGTCFTFNEAMPGTVCDQFTNGGKSSREDCDNGELTPSAISTAEGSDCDLYLGVNCTQGFTGFVRGQCVNPQYSNKPFMSFQCYDDRGN